MKIENVKKLTIEEFEKELTQENFNYIQEKYPSSTRALECYKEGALEINEESYMDINDYFSACKDMDEEMESLRDLES